MTEETKPLQARRYEIFAGGVLALAAAIISYELYTVAAEADDATHRILGGILFFLAGGWIVWRLLGRYSARVKTAYDAIWLRLEAMPDRLKVFIFFTLGLLCLGAYFYCHHVCSKRLYTFTEKMELFHRMFAYSFSTFTFFIPSCIAAGYIIKMFSEQRRVWPSGMLGNCAIAAVLPMCACGAVPLVAGLLGSKTVRLRSAIAFLITVPVLSPFVILFSFQLGATYALLRIFTVVLLAVIAGVLVEAFSKEQVDAASADSPVGRFACAGCPGASGKSRSDNAFLIGWDIFMSLVFYVAVGIFIGTLLSLPSLSPQAFFRPDVLGIVVIVLLSLPLFLCAGQEIVLLIPFSGALLASADPASTLPVGHALAFSIAGPGICISSIPVLGKVLGRRATTLVVLSFGVGAVLIGVAVNMLTGGRW